MDYWRNATPFAQIGVLPAWFRSGEEVIYERDFQHRLTLEETEAELVTLEAEIEPYFEEAKIAALNHASIEMAQVAPSVRKVGGRRARQDLKAAMVAKIKQEHPDWSIEEICKGLDKKTCPMRDVDKRAGYSSWHDAWKDLKEKK